MLWYRRSRFVFNAVLGSAVVDNDIAGNDHPGGKVAVWRSRLVAVRLWLAFGSVAALTLLPTALAAEDATSASHAERLISVDFEQAEMKDVLRAFAQFTGLNVMAGDAVKGEVTVRLDNVPWREAFERLLDANGLAMSQQGTVIWVAPASEMNKRERERLEAHARQIESEPLASRLFDLHYQRAEDIHRLLTGSTQQVLSKRGAASADVRSNRLFVSDIPARLEQIGTMIAAFDQPARQVMIEARIVEADDGFSRNLGFRLGASGDVARERISAPDGNFFDLPSGGLHGLNAAGAALGLFRAGVDGLITLELSMLEANGLGKVLSSPRVVTTDRNKAVIEQGTELPYQTKVRSGVSGLQFRRASLRLEVTPHITPELRVSLDVDVSKDTVGVETAAGPAIDTKHIKTQVEVDNGGTVAIGGIFARSERRDVVGVPVLHKLPVIGALFRRTTVTDRKTELIVFITPTVIEAGRPWQAESATASLVTEALEEGNLAKTEAMRGTSSSNCAVNSATSADFAL